MAASVIDWIRGRLREELMVGKGNPAKTDTLNRALKTVLRRSGMLRAGNEDNDVFHGLHGPVFNVHAHGAAGDGVTNDSLAIQSAVDAAADAGGGIVVLGKATYVGAVWLYGSNVTLYMPNAVLKHPPTSTRVVTDGACTVGSKVVTSITAAWTTADIGKWIDVTDGGISTALSLVGRIESLGPGANQVTLNNAAGSTQSGKRVAIDETMNVVNSGKFYLASSADLLSNHTIVGGVIDGNRANTTAPFLSTEDRGGHGWGVSRTVGARCIGTIFQNCHNAGLEVVVNSDQFIATGVNIKNCGNSIAIGAGFEMNSSAECFMQGTVTDCYAGARLLDNSYDNVWDLTIVRTTVQGLIIDNQLGNVSRNCFVKATVSEASKGSVAFNAVTLGAKVQDHTCDFNISYAGQERGGTNTYVARSDAYGLQVGSEVLSDANKPQRNLIRAKISNCGGGGLLDEGIYNTYSELVLIDNARKTPLGHYALDVRGSHNTYNRVTFYNNSATQRGCAVRPTIGEVGTACTDNKFDFARENNQNPYDDTSTNTTNQPPARPFQVALGPNRGDADWTWTPGQPNIVLMSTAVTVPRTGTLSTTDARIDEEVWLKRTGLGAGTVDFGGLKTIPAATAAMVGAKFSGSVWYLIAYMVL